MSRRTLLIVVAVFLVVLGVVWTRLPDGAAPDEQASPGQPPSVELLGAGVPIAPGADAAVRVGFDPADPSVRVIATVAGDSRALLFCPLAVVTDPIPGRERCRGASSGVREALTGPGGALGGVAVVLVEGAQTTMELRLEYAERTREVEVRLPVIPPATDRARCRDNGCNPFFEMLPLRSGTLEASVTWDGGAARLEVLQGTVRARSFTATGIPYRVPASDAGASPLEVSTSVTASGEYAVAFLDPSPGASATAYRDVVLRATWPPTR